MRNSRLASRYAKSLIGLSVERKELEAVYADMKLVAGVCSENKDLSVLLKSPIVKTDKKVKILEQIFAGKLAATSHAFIKIITEKKREQYLQNIAQAFIEQYKEHKNIITANVKTTFKLDEKLKTSILELVKSGTNSQVELNEEIDKNIVGGFILRIGDKQVDASIQNKLHNLKKSFSKNPYIKEY
jgi:F-type H+-transporting ATPase subunit delta